MLGLACLGGIGEWLARWRSPPAAAPDPADAPGRMARALGLALGGLLLAGLGLAAAATLDQARAQARWLAAHLAPAVVFGQAREAERALQALQALAQVQGAWVFGPDDRHLAGQVSGRPADDAGPGLRHGSCHPLQAGAAWQAHTPDRLLISQAVHYLGVPVGRLCLAISLTGFYRQAAVATLLAGVFGLLAWGACLGRGWR